MNRNLPVIVGFIAIAASITYAQFFRGPAQNPDPNHTHADFALWIDGEQMEFTDPKYMSEVYKEGQQVRVDPLRKYLHLHDGIGHVIHRHKPGLALDEFFGSLGIALYFNPLGSNEPCITFQGMIGPNSPCDTEEKKWRMFVDGIEMPFTPDYVFEDTDHILLTYGSTDAEIREQLDQMTDDACRYSKTCPWRGAPPAENCIADPAVPCVIPE